MIAQIVDTFWCAFFGVGRDVLHRPGVHVVGDAPALADNDRTFLFRIGETCVIAVPEARRARVESMAAGQSADAVFDLGFAAACGPDGGPVLGPSWHSYVDRASFRPVPVADVRRIDASDADAIERLRTSTHPDEWSEGGFVPLPDALWGRFDGDEIVALGNMTEWNGGRSDVGLVTHQAHRGRGFGASVASAMTRSALERVDVVRYRALASNAASLRVAGRLGFTGYGQNIVVRPPA